ncbi:hypothetical protein LZ31DRAFT_266000 [Colletotrichum somersetense]|nr:hypothetical protein LZ31DRAFT_266000 [Colletotrichum somersetense]
MLEPRPRSLFRINLKTSLCAEVSPMPERFLGSSKKKKRRKKRKTKKKQQVGQVPQLTFHQSLSRSTPDTNVPFLVSQCLSARLTKGFRNGTFSWRGR